MFVCDGTLIQCKFRFYFYNAPLLTLSSICVLPWHDWGHFCICCPNHRGLFFPNITKKFLLGLGLWTLSWFVYSNYDCNLLLSLCRVIIVYCFVIGQTLKSWFDPKIYKHENYFVNIHYLLTIWFPSYSNVSIEQVRKTLQILSWDWIPFQFILNFSVFLYVPTITNKRNFPFSLWHNFFVQK